MSEIKALLESLDEMRGKAVLYGNGKGKEVWGFMVPPNSEYLIALHTYYPTLRAHIARLEREAEAGRVLAEAVRGMHSDLDDYAGSEGDERGMWENQRDAILKSYEEETV